jgi:hypothetical protein
MLSLPAQFFDVLLAWIPDVECSYDEATYITRYGTAVPCGGRTQGCHGRHWPACAAESGSQSMAAAAPPRAVTTLVDQRSGAMPVAALISRTALRESHMG